MNIFMYMGHLERSGREPDIRPACPVASTPAPDGWGQGSSEPKQPKQCACSQTGRNTAETTEGEAMHLVSPRRVE